MGRFRFRRALRFLGFAVVFAGLTGLVVMSLWNALLPPIVGVSAITFWQALGLLVLSRILFGGVGWRGRGGYGRPAWKQKMTERWQNMTPEQRERMKQQWRERCENRQPSRWGRGPQPGSPGANEPAGPGSTTI